MPDKPVTITLTADEALVLRAFVERGEAAGGNYALVHGGELAALWKLEGALDKVVVPPETDISYEEALNAARGRLAERAGTQDWRSLLGAGPP